MRGRVVVNGRKLVESSRYAHLRGAGDARLLARIREGDRRAFEALYDRHAAEMLRFGSYMLGSRHDAEDAVQAAFAAAWRALLADRRPVALRPWLFTITRNECVTMLRARRPTVELNGELARSGDPVEHLIVGEDLRLLLESIARLPEQQRVALLLAEAHGLSHPEIASVLGVRTDQIKAFVYQARMNLTADRRARESDCEEIRSELERSRGHGLLRGAIRRHLRDCPGCREHADGVARRRRHFRAVLPFVPSLALKHRVLEGSLGLGSLGGGGSVAAGPLGGLAELAAGTGAVAFKAAAGIVALSLTAGVGVSSLAASHRSAGPAVAVPRVTAVAAKTTAQVRPRRSRPGAATGSRGAEKRRGSHPSMSASNDARPSGAGSYVRFQAAPQTGVADSAIRPAARAAHAENVVPAPGVAKHRQEATKLGPERGKSEQAKEAHKARTEEHASAPEAAHGASEEHRGEDVAKGPPAEEEHRQKLEAHEQKREEQKEAHTPQG